MMHWKDYSPIVSQSKQRQTGADWHMGSEATLDPTIPGSQRESLAQQSRGLGRAGREGWGTSALSSPPSPPPQQAPQKGQQERPGQM